MKNAKPKKRTQGMNWISKKKRLAIYNRDGFACAYCGRTVEDGARLSLDHIKPHSHGGSNDARNLVTCCATCNSSRQDRPMAEFARTVAEYRNTEAKNIINHVNACRRRNLNLEAAKEIMSRRANWTEIVKNGYK